MKRSVCLWFGLATMAILSGESSVCAQVVPELPPEIAAKLGQMPGVTAAVGDAESGLTPPQGEAQITFGPDSRAVLSLSDTFSNGLQWQVVFSSPLASENGAVELQTLDRLAAGTKAQFGLDYVLLDPKPGSFADLTEACKSVKAALADKKLEDVPSHCDDRLYGFAYRHGVSRDVLKRVTAAYFGNAYLKKLGVDVAASYDDYDFLDETLAKSSGRRTSAEAGIRASISRVIDSWSLIASLKRQRAYRNDESSLSQICVPIDGTAASRCAEAYLAPPRRIDDTVSSLEWRWQRTDDVAIAIHASYSQKDHVTGVSIPLYFFSNAARTLRGGVKFNWRNDTHDTQTVFFVSSGFDLL
jgi:hypothetical protein